MVFDNTDHKQIEAALRSEYDFVETVLDTAGAIVVVLDRRGQIIRFNRAAEEMTGYTFAEVRGRSVWELFPTRSEMEPVKAAFISGEFEASQFPDKRELEWLRGDGQRRLLTFTNTALFDPDGLVKYVVSVGNDITAARQAEEALRRSEARNRAMLDAIPDLMFRLGIDGTFLDYDCPPDVSLYVPPQEFIGQQVFDVLPRELAQKLMRCLEQAQATGHMQILEYQLPSNEANDYEARIVASGRSEAMVIVRDMTERKQAQQKIIKAERLAALGRLATTLAHEINNPLQAIRGNLDLVLDFPLEAEERADHLQIIAEEIERLIDITRRVLSFAHPVQKPRQPVSVIELAQRTLALIGERLQTARIQVSTDWQDVPPVMAAPDQLTQVFLNLVINAIEAIPKGGQLKVGTYASGGLVEISFANDGPPIGNKDISHIFEPFFTTKSGGSGLGLSTSHNLVRQHGGRLTVENLQDGQGVIFTVKLPPQLGPYVSGNDPHV